MSSLELRDTELLARVNTLISPYGCVATDLGPDSVGVMGDGRAVGASVFISFPADATTEFYTKVSTEITNKVPGITRVLMNIPTSPQVPLVTEANVPGPGSALPRISQAEFDEFQKKLREENPNYVKELYDEAIREFNENWGIDPNSPTDYERM